MSRSVRRLARACAQLSINALVVAGACTHPAPAAADGAPTVASINLCADQLVLELADPEQILSVSWLAADPHESLFAAEARRYALNYGSAEELLSLRPDIVIAGTYTSPFSRALLRRLGRRVIELAPEVAIADIERNVRLVAAAIGQTKRGEELVAGLRADVDQLAAHRPAMKLATVVVRPGGFTVGSGSLADELIALAGLRNVAAEQGLDRWGTLSMETLLRSSPELVVLTDYRAEQPSLANTVLDHPALTRLGGERATVTVPAALWSCGLPRSIEAAKLLQRAARE
jgi:iron complex transport system substrate-binding protein